MIVAEGDCKQPRSSSNIPERGRYMYRWILQYSGLAGGIVIALGIVIMMGAILLALKKDKRK